MRAPETIQVELYGTPVSTKPIRLECTPATIQKILDRLEWHRSTDVLLNGLAVAPELWSTIRPKAGSHVVVVGRPGEGFTAAIAAFFIAAGKAAAGVLSLGAIGGGTGIAAGGFGPALAGVAGSLVGQAVGTAALSFGLNALAGALISGPDQDRMGDGSTGVSPTFNGTGNTVRPGAPFPYVAGDFRFQPTLGAFPFSVIRGADNILYAILIVGLGQHSFTVDDIMIGDLPITQFARANVVIRQGLTGDPGLTLFTDRVFQTALNSTFDPLPFNDPTLMSPWVQFPVQGTGHDKLGVDFSFPTGLGVSRAGGLRNYFFGMQIEFRANGGDWFDAIQQFDFGPLGGAGNTSAVAFQGLSLVQFIGASPSAFQVGFTWSTGGSGAPLSYDVRIRRVEIISPNVLPGGSETLGTVGTFIWFALKGFNFNEPPLQISGVATIELELPIDEQFNGALNNLSVEARRKYRIYNPGDPGGVDADGWTNLQYVSSNPAAIIRDMLQGVNNRRPRTNAQIDIPALTAFYTYCATYDDAGSGPLRYDFIFEERLLLFNACAAVAAAGRGRFGQNGRGILTVVFDGPKGAQVGVNLINAANCRGFRMQLDYPREIHAIRAQFVDATSGFDPDAEMIVYEDGYSGDGAGGTIVAEDDQIETVSFPGTTQPPLIYALARYFLAVPQLRPRAIEVEMDLEQLGFSVGELVDFAHPAGLFSSSDGLIKSSSSAVYRDLFDREQAPWSDNTRDLLAATAVYGELSGAQVRGEGSLLLTSTATSTARISQQLGIAHDWSGCRFDVDVVVGALSNLSTFDGIRVRLLGPTLSDYKEWQFGTDLGLNATTFETVGETLASTPSASSGYFSAASVIRWEIYANVVGGAVGRLYRFSDFRISQTSGAISEIELDQGLEFVAGLTYSIVYRRIDTGNAINVPEVKPLRNLASFGVTSDRLNRYAYLTTPITASTTEPLEGNLFSFGQSDSVRIRAIVKDKLAGPDLTARVILVDEAPGLHAVAGTIPDFEPGTTLPVSIRQIGPGQPQLRQVVSDERALAISGDGTLKPRILIHVVSSTQRGRPIGDFFTGRYRRIAPSGLQAIPIARVDASASEISIQDVDEGATYEISLQVVTRLGLASEPLVFTHTVIGKSTRPPNVQDFRLEGTLLRWTLAERPLDLAGFKILRGAIGTEISQARWITEPMLVAAPPFDTSGLDPDTSQLFILTVDTAMNESAIPAVITGFIGNVPVQNVVNTIDIAAAGFPTIDQINSVMGDFERLIPKEVPDGELAVVYGPGDVEDILSPIEGDGQTTLDVEMGIIFAGVRALKLTDLDASGSKFTITYAMDINRTKCKLRSRLRGAKASVTWTVRYRLIDFADTNKWSRWDVSGLATQSYVNAQVDLTTAATATGSSGAVDLTRFRYLEIELDPSTAAVNDVALLDSLEWVGGAINGVEVESGDLKTMAQSDQFWNATGSVQFWNPVGTAAFWGTVIYLAGIYEFEAEVVAGDIPSDLRLEFNDPGVPFTVFYKLNGTFVPFPGVIEDVAVGFYSFQLRLAGGFVRAVITDLAVILDVADERETINDFSVSNTGTVRLPIVGTYREIRDVFPVVQGSTPGVFVLLDKDAALGPSVQVVNLAGSRITALVDASIVGVKG